MRIIIDGDGCPNLNEIFFISKLYNKEMIVFVDYSHIIDMDCQVIYCDISKDSVDMEIVKYLKRNDLLITQDYGLANFALMKHAYVLHPSAKLITQDNIELLLGQRYATLMLKKAGKRVKGPSRRDEQTIQLFLKELIKIIETIDE